MLNVLKYICRCFSENLNDSPSHYQIRNSGSFVIKQEHMNTKGSPEDQRKSRTEVADAESNTMHSADADSAAEGGGSPTPGVPADTLTCGACRKAFALADRFIQHKDSSCDKDLTSYHCYSAGPNSDQEDGSRPGHVVTGNSSGRRPSLLTARRPPSSRVHTPPLVSPSIAPPDLLEDGGASSTPKRLLHEADHGASTPKRRASTSPMPSSSPDEDIKPKILSVWQITLN